MRIDKKKSLVKVAKSALNDSLLTDRERAEELWIGKSTVNRAMQELGQAGAKDDRIQGLLDWDLILAKKIQAAKLRRMENDDKINNSDIDKWEQTATKRLAIFWKWLEWNEDREIVIQI